MSPKVKLSHVLTQSAVLPADRSDVLFWAQNKIWVKLPRLEFGTIPEVAPQNGISTESPWKNSRPEKFIFSIVTSGWPLTAVRDYVTGCFVLRQTKIFQDLPIYGKCDGWICEEMRIFLHQWPQHVGQISGPGFYTLKLRQKINFGVQFFYFEINLARLLWPKIISV